jgi:hypothetical protein
LCAPFIVPISRKADDLELQLGRRDMKDTLRFKDTLTFAAIVLVMFVASEPAVARGGAASIMNSPGYQRRLQESRQQLAQPDLQPPSRAVRHEPRHRHRH